MNTRFWGPSGWRFLHTISNIYPQKPTMNDKIMITEFMELVADVLPCKYCRASFTKYSQSLNITPYLENNILIQEWMYRMHNKVNSKLRRQGFCTTENPSLEEVIIKYDKLGKHVMNSIYHNDKIPGGEKVQELINHISKLGFDFLGSIIFNYQGYFANCHTSEEKVKIISSYHKFFNMIPRIIFTFMKSYYPPSKTNQVLSSWITHSERPKGWLNFKIRSILQKNSEPYTLLKKWFWSCDFLGTCGYWKMTYEEYEKHFNKHIVNSCNTVDADKIKSCRKLSKKDVKTRSKILSRKH